MTGRVEINLVGLDPIIVKNTGSSYDVVWNKLSVSLSEIQLNSLINILTIKKNAVTPVIVAGKRIGQHTSINFGGKSLQFNDFQIDQIIAALEKVKRI